MSAIKSSREGKLVLPEQICALCAEGTAVQTIQVQEFQYGTGHQAAVLRAKVPVWQCHACDESYVDEEGEAAQHASICRHLGRLAPAEVRAIRKGLELKQDEFATKLGVGVASVKRWELGKAIPNHLADEAIRRLAAAGRRQRSPVFQTPITDQIRAAAERFRLRQHEPELMAA